MKNIITKKTFRSNLGLLIFTLCFSKINAGTFYWVGGSGNWSDYQHHWSTTSGGATFQIHQVTPLDDVIFDNNSFTTSNDNLY